MTHTDGTTIRLDSAVPTCRSNGATGRLSSWPYATDCASSGELYSYSSHSTALLGYLVERVSGIPLRPIHWQNIFQPLNAPHIPPATAACFSFDLAVGYQYQKVTLNRSLSVSQYRTSCGAANNCHRYGFMIAHLLKGRKTRASWKRISCGCMTSTSPTILCYLVLPTVFMNGWKITFGRSNTWAVCGDTQAPLPYCRPKYWDLYCNQQF